jgi:N6-adenosine-specific RNA methylase IME4
VSHEAFAKIAAGLIDAATGNVTARPYRCIAADPPWCEYGGGKIKRGADRHYRLLRYPEIIKLMREQLDGKIAESCHLWLWVTDNHLLDGLYVIEALGFRYVRTMCWVKMRDGNLQTGLGQYLRGSHELCLFSVRGKTCKPATGNRRPSVVLAGRSLHSAKPSAAYDVIEAVSPGPRLEMFARSPRIGWDVWGDQAIG